jgi:hypothetical protein
MSCDRMTGWKSRRCSSSFLLSCLNFTLRFICLLPEGHVLILHDGHLIHIPHVAIWHMMMRGHIYYSTYVE